MCVYVCMYQIDRLTHIKFVNRLLVSKGSDFRRFYDEEIYIHG